MNLLVIFVICIFSSIGCNAFFYHHSVSGDMDVEWDEEKQVWNATLHLPSTIDYSKVKKLIIKVKPK